YCSRDLRVLHSFPTRRSSDLVFLAFVRSQCNQASFRMIGPYCPGSIETGTVWHADIEKSNIRQKLLKESDSLVAVRCFRHHGHIDRKSTRLNSSHDQISYAVF